MNPLPAPDSHRLRAASGWLELGCGEEAAEELNGIAPGNQNHPDVLELRWELLADAHDWTAAAEAARTLREFDPDRVAGWLHYAYALRRCDGGGVQLAFEALVNAVDLFPLESTVPYNLACYACQLERSDEAMAWLDRACKVGSKSSIKSMALEDEDLKALWSRIQSL